jgi:hypothetical protein
MLRNQKRAVKKKRGVGAVVEEEIEEYGAGGGGGGGGEASELSPLADDLLTRPPQRYKTANVCTFLSLCYFHYPTMLGFEQYLFLHSVKWHSSNVVRSPACNTSQFEPHVRNDLKSKFEHCSSFRLR